MKPKFFLKGAVVAMAAFGAFAFNGNEQPSDLFSYKPDESTCTNIHAECSDNQAGPYCKILMNNVPVDVYDFSCSKLIRHDDSTPVSWTPINP